MRKNLFIALVCLAPLLAQSQSNVPGRFSLSTGFDVGVHGVVSELTYQGTLSDQDTTGAGTKQFTFNAHYGIAKWFSAGLGFKNGYYLESVEENKSKQNKIGQFYVDTRFYFLNKDKINLYAGFSLGATKLDVHRETNYGLFIITEDYQLSSGYSRFQFGLNWWIGNKVGFWMNMEGNKHNFKLNSFSLNGDAQNLDDWDFTMRTAGFQTSFGVCIKFK
ncbi:MAG TPA: hypothetical protein VK177_03580 [Flavobacteriales bacterium]|nr:hypothetical protein [Flavobacteriales bacterium]